MPRGIWTCIELVAPIAHYIRHHVNESGALHERRFDLLIADVNLGTASGIDLVRRSREIDLGIKSVLTSGYPIASALKSDPALRCTGFLNKPFTPAELYECLKGTIDSDCV